MQVPTGTFVVPGGYSPNGNYSPPSYSYYPQTYAPFPIHVLTLEEQQQAKEFRDTLTQLRSADTTEAKVAARERLSAIVSAQLDRDFKERERKLAEIEARAKVLREQLEQRRTSKAEIQKMLMLMIENPETGLGLPQAWMSMLNQTVTPPMPVPIPVYSSPGTVLPSTAAPTNRTSLPAISKPQTHSEAYEQSLPAAARK